jgi:hypothetical protein
MLMKQSCFFCWTFALVDYCNTAWCGSLLSTLINVKSRTYLYYKSARPLVSIRHAAAAVFELSCELPVDCRPCGAAIFELSFELFVGRFRVFDTARKLVNLRWERIFCISLLSCFHYLFDSFILKHFNVCSLPWIWHILSRNDQSLQRTDLDL